MYSRAFYFAVLLLTYINAAAQKIDLSGEWLFAIDKYDKGIKEHWFLKALNEKVVLPGSMATNGKGYDVTVNTKWMGQIVDSSYFKKDEYKKYRQPGNIKIPFWLQPLKYYAGAAWYQKEVIIPTSWKGQTIKLLLERCHWESRLWIDGRECGMRNSLGTPHLYDLSMILTPGTHRISICIDNRIKIIDPGINSHSITDHTQTNWNGIIGQMYLEAKPKISIKSIQMFPDIHQKKIVAKVVLDNRTQKKQNGFLSLLIDGVNTLPKNNYNISLAQGTDTLVFEYELDEKMKTWSEFHPNLYQLKINISVPNLKLQDSCSTTFGMREIKAAGNKLLINDKPLFLRGTLECAIFPKTGFPPTQISEWLRIFRICRDHGLNHMRFHSWCPPQAAFDAADQSGFYLQVECSSWANVSTTIGDGKPLDKYLYEESQRMVEQYGNHPSFCMMLYGNEPAGANKDAFLTKFVTYWKDKDSRRIYTSGAGWPNLDVNDYQSTMNPRIQGWGEGLGSIINKKAPASDYDWTEKIKGFHQPVVSHEIGQWCVYPNFKEIPKYTGIVEAKNFEIFQETLKDHGMAQLADSFLLSSGKLQALCYKADIEAALRTKDFGGFQLLDLHDFPGQGTALVGVLDPFWDEKGYITPAAYSRFCNSTVPLARLKKHIYYNTDTLSVAIEVAHYGDDAIQSCVPEWSIKDISGKVVFSGKLAKTDIPLGNCFSLGQISTPLASINKAEKLILEVSTGSFSNSWDIWVYPASKDVVAGADKIKVVSTIDASTQKFLEEGGSVLLSLKKGNLKPEFGGKIEIGFSSIFWNTAWTGGQAPHTLGILCDPKHPALADFPTEYYSNWQWWDAMSHSNAIRIDAVSKDIQPIVRVIDDWFTNRPIALLFEVSVGKGKLLLSGIDFNQDMENRPEAQQLLYSLKKYMAGDHFNPTVKVDSNKIKNLIALSQKFEK
ncbi:MAG: sugar-binding domain-containing protein [Bacteroidota bacterium]